jgi:hemerythrin
MNKSKELEDKMFMLGLSTIRKHNLLKQGNHLFDTAINTEEYQTNKKQYEQIQLLITSLIEQIEEDFDLEEEFKINTLFNNLFNNKQ